MTDVADIVERLRSIEDELRDLAFDRLREAAASGDTEAVREERRLQQARRAVERARRALEGPADDD